MWFRTSCARFIQSCAHLASNRFPCQLIQKEPVCGDKAGVKGSLLQHISEGFFFCCFVERFQINTGEHTAVI